MPAVAIYSKDSLLRSRLDRDLGTAVEIAGVVDNPRALTRLFLRHQVDVLLADSTMLPQLTDWRGARQHTALIVLIDANELDEALEALHAGADAVLPLASECPEILAAIEATTRELSVLPRMLVDILLEVRSPASDELRPEIGPDHPQLTNREREVLTAMANGASNKAIARRLHISFHTVKFHVAAILVKLDADSRTEAVAKAAHLGLVML